MTSSRVGKVVITGARGQLGLELQATAPAGWDVLACGSEELDVTQPESVRTVLEREQPALVIQAAAYTDVDAAERNVDRAEAVNARGAANVAIAAVRVRARMIYVSTDFVFDGNQGRPYAPDDRANPLGVYGRSKLSGEREVARITDGAGLILRTAWLYSVHGRNFARTMLRLMRERESLGVVYDQVGTPTWGRSLGETLWAVAEHPELRGILHWTDAGVASWYDFAVAIQEEALTLGLLSAAVPIRPVTTEEFPRPARRPAYSVLDKTATWAALGGPSRHWRANLRLMLQSLPHA